jgi:hypothetical protein
VTSVPSVPYAEGVLLFHRTPALERTSDEVARALYLPEKNAEELLSAMCDAGVLERREASGVRYAYAPRDQHLADAIERLSAAYASSMIEVTNLIHDPTGKGARRFADAFRLRKAR